MKNILFLLLFLASKNVLFAQSTGAVDRYCDQGARNALTSGLSSSNYLQDLVPRCTVTVFLTGTTNLATIYKDANNTPLTNPFQADTNGHYLFFSAINQGLDVNLSGGYAPNIYNPPVTVVDIFPSQSFNPVAGVTSLSATEPIQVNGAQGPVTGGVTVSCENATPSKIGCSRPDNTTITVNNGVLTGLSASGQLLMQVNPPPPGAEQAIIYPTSVSGTGFAQNTVSCGGSANVTSCSASGPLANGGSLAHPYCSSGCTSNPTITWTFTAPSYLPATGLTVYGGNVSYSYTTTAIGNMGVSSMTCGIGGSQTNVSVYDVGTAPPPLQTYTAALSGVTTSSQVSTVTCTAAINETDPVQAGAFGNFPSVFLVINYTGTAPPANTAITVIPPLNFNPGPNSLSLVVPFDVGIDTGSANAYAVSLPWVTQAPGTTIKFVPAHLSTSTTPTFNLSGIGAATIVGPQGGALQSGDLNTTATAIVVLDNAGNWRLQDPQVSGSAGNAITALTGDVTATGPGSAAATLATTGVTAGSYTNTNLTVDSKGRITSASNGSSTGGVSAITPGTNVTCSPLSGGTCVGNVTVNSSGGGGSGGAAYFAGNFLIFGDSRMNISQSYQTNDPTYPSYNNEGPITSGTVTGGVATFNATNYTASGNTIMLYGFTGSYTPLNNQIVTLSGATGTTLTATVTGVPDGSTGTGNFIGAYNLPGDLMRSSALSKATIVQLVTGNLNSTNAVSQATALLTAYNPSTTGKPAIALIQVGSGDFYLSGGGCSAATTESNLAKIYAIAHSFGIQVMATTIIPELANINCGGNSTVNVAQLTLPVSNYIRYNLAKGLNTINGTGCPATYTNCYWDYLEDAVDLFGDPTNTAAFQGSGHMNDQGASAWAADVAHAMSTTDSQEHVIPDFGNDVARLTGSNNYFTGNVYLNGSTYFGGVKSSNDVCFAAGLGTIGALTNSGCQASNLYGTPALPNGTTATTQSPGDNTTKLATDAFVLANAGGGGLNGTVTYTTSTTASTSDASKLVIMNCSAACAYTLPATQPSTTWAAGVTSQGSTVATIALGGGDTFNGSASVPVLNSYRILWVFANTTTSTDYRGDAPLAPGSNVTFTPTSNALTVAAAGSGGIANTTTTVGTTTINANTCTTASTVTMTGVATTSVFDFTPSTDISATTGWGSSGGLTIVAWPTANTLNYKVCNQTASNITPGGSVTFNVGAR